MYIKQCPQCNNEFKTKHKQSVCCSAKCNGIMKRTHSFEKECQLCSKQYVSRHKESKFCSKECQTEDSKNGTIIKCKSCNVDMYVANFKTLQDSNFCSRECYLKEHKVKEVITKCDTCNKDIVRSYTTKSKKNYCNDNCRSNRNEVLTCKICKANFCSIQYRKANNDNGFVITRPFKITCSDNCLSEFYRTDKDRKEKISIAFSGEKHPNYINGCSYNGRIRKTDLKENFSNRDKIELFARFDSKCFKCNSTSYLSIDHNIPFSRGGRLTFTNSVLLCRSCNSKKNAKMPNDFYTNAELMKLKKLGIDSNSLFNYS